MKMQKEIIDMSMFEKKKITLKQLGEKISALKKMSERFLYWDFKIEDNQVKNLNTSFLLVLFFTILPSILFLLVMINKNNILAPLAIVLFGNIGIIGFLRSLKFGIFRNRYKKWKKLINDIQPIMHNKEEVFSLLLETELNLKNLQEQVVENQEIKNLINDSIENLIEELKELFANYNDDDLESMEKLTAKINEISIYQEEILKSIKTYHLKTEYVEYKKNQGIIEDKQKVENQIIRDFKAIL